MVPSLVSLCQSKCLQYCSVISDVGTTPYHLVEPILKRKSAKALKAIEDKSNQIGDNSVRIWTFLIQRDFSDRPTQQGQVLGRQLYDKYEAQLSNQLVQVTSNLKQMQRQLSKNKSKVKQIPILPGVRRPVVRHAVVSRPRAVFKSSILEKARLENKRRVRNFKR